MVERELKIEAIQSALTKMTDREKLDLLNDLMGDGLYDRIDNELLELDDECLDVLFRKYGEIEELEERGIWNFGNWIISIGNDQIVLENKQDIDHLKYTFTRGSNGWIRFLHDRIDKEVEIYWSDLERIADRREK